VPGDAFCPRAAIHADAENPGNPGALRPLVLFNENESEKVLFFFKILFEIFLFLYYFICSKQE